MAAAREKITVLKVKRWKSYLKHNGLIAGMSNNFHNIQEIRKYYEQALKAADLGQRILQESGLHRYENMSNLSYYGNL